MNKTGDALHADIDPAGIFPLPDKAKKLGVFAKISPFFAQLKVWSDRTSHIAL